jgi:hypothetical protein
VVVLVDSDLYFGFAYAMNEERCTEPGGGFVRRMSALARKSRARSKRDATAPPGTAPSPSDVTAVESVPFVNHGLDFWNKQREEWTTPTQRRRRGPAEGRTHGMAGRAEDGAALDNPSGRGHERGPAGDEGTSELDDRALQGGWHESRHDTWHRDVRETIDAEELYNELLSPQYTAFPRRVPLGELIEVLLDVWEQDGVIG